MLTRNPFQPVSPVSSDNINSKKCCLREIGQKGRKKRSEKKLSGVPPQGPTAGPLFYFSHYIRNCKAHIIRLWVHSSGTIEKCTTGTFLLKVTHNCSVREPQGNFQKIPVFSPGEEEFVNILLTIWCCVHSWKTTLAV